MSLPSVATLVVLCTCAVALSSASSSSSSSSSGHHHGGPWVIDGQGWNLTLYERPEWILEIQEEKQPYLPIFATIAALLEAQHHATTGWAAIDGTQVDLLNSYVWTARGAPQNTSFGFVFFLDGTPLAQPAPRIGIEIRAFPDTPPYQDALAMRLIVTVHDYAWRSAEAAAVALLHRFTVDGRSVVTPLRDNSLNFGEAMFTASAQARVQTPTANSTVKVDMWQFHNNYWQLHERFAADGTLIAEDVVHVLEPRTLSSDASHRGRRSSDGSDDDDEVVLIVCCVAAALFVFGGFLGGLFWYRRTHSNSHSIA